LSLHRDPPKRSLSAGEKIGIAVVVLIITPFLIAGMVSGARQTLDSKPAPAMSRPLPAPVSTSAAPTHHVSAARQHSRSAPTFSYPGDPQCAITYRAEGNDRMSWTASVTVAGQLITHASDVSGSIYRHDVQVTRGVTQFVAKVPLSRIDDVGGVLYVGSTSYGCSISPLRQSVSR
jgi:hypothetical protein